MAQQQHPSEEVVTEPGTALFPNLFEAKAVVVQGVEKGEPKYSLEVLFESKQEIQPVLQAAQRLLQQRFPKRDKSELRMLVTSGDKKAAKQEENGYDAEFYKGKFVLKANSKYAPGVVNSATQKIIDPSEIYSGMQARVHVLLKTYETGDNAGVTAYLMNVMKTADGEKLVGGKSAQQAFADFATTGQSTDVDPTAGAGGDDLPWE